MRVGIVGAGRIGGNCATQLAKGGHEVKLSGRDLAKLEPLAAEIGGQANVGSPAEAAEFGEVVVIAVPWEGFDDAEAKEVVIGLITDAGYVPVDVGSNADAAVMEMQRRPGAVYGEEYRLPDAQKVVEAVQAGDKIPPTPSYS